jgi:hypothetical protein
MLHAIHISEYLFFFFMFQVESTLVAVQVLMRVLCAEY